MKGIEMAIAELAVVFSMLAIIAEVVGQ